MVFLNALGSMASIAILALIGYAVSRLGWVSGSTAKFLPRFLTQVVIPPFLMSSMVFNFKRDELFDLIKGSCVPFISIVLTFGLAIVLSHLLKIDKSHRYAFAVGTCTSSTMLIGLPVGIALQGEQSIPYTLLYFIGNTTFFWTIGNYFLAKDGTRPVAPGIAAHLRNIFSPPLCGTLTGIAIIILDLPFPKVIADFCHYMGKLTTPLALVTIGIILQRIDWKTVHIGRDILLGLAGRTIMAPVILIGCLMLCPFRPCEMEVLIIQAGLPVMPNIAILTAYYGGDKAYSSVLVATSTIFGLLSVPIWLAVLRTFLHT